MTYKKVFSAPDAAPVVLYAKKDANSQFAYPLIQSMLNPGFSIPMYDEIDADSMSRPTSVIFKLSGSTVATLSITYTGSAVNIVRT